MKKQLLASAAIILMGSLITTSSAQTNFKSYKTDISKVGPAKTTAGNIEEKEVDIRAVRKFRKSHPDAPGAIWRKTNGLYVVTFTQDDIRHKIVYNHKGHQSYSVKVLEPEQLPSTLYRNIRSNFYDDEITTAQELEVENRTIYLVQLSGKKEWKMLRIEDGDIQVMNRLQKQ